MVCFDIFSFLNFAKKFQNFKKNSFTCPVTGDMYVKVNWVDTQDHNSCPMKLCSAAQKETPACKYGKPSMKYLEFGKAVI